MSTNINSNASKHSGFSEFYLGVLYGSPYNFFTTRNKFKINWSDPNEKYSSSYSAAKQYSSLSKQILSVFQNFKLYVDHIDLPGIQIAGGDVINDGKGTYYYQGDQMISPEENTVIVWFRETMISISDLAYKWIYFNATPWIRPIKLNLNIDYYSDYDGKTSVMAYQLDGCRPIEIDMINATHDSKEVILRGIKLGFNTITPVSCNGGSKNTSAIDQNWNSLLKQIKMNQSQDSDSTIFSEIKNSWTSSEGFWNTTADITGTLITGKSANYSAQSSGSGTSTEVTRTK